MFFFFLLAAAKRKRNWNFNYTAVLGNLINDIILRLALLSRIIEIHSLFSNNWHVYCTTNNFTVLPQIMVFMLTLNSKMVLCSHSYQLEFQHTTLYVPNYNVFYFEFIIEIFKELKPFSPFISSLFLALLKKKGIKNIVGSNFTSSLTSVLRSCFNLLIERPL